MKAVILAGGLGKRLRPITEDVPKPLVPVLDKPVVEWTLEVLPPEITEIIFVIGHKGEMIRERYGDRAFGRTVAYVTQEKQLGTAHAVKCAAPLLDTPFLLLYGDDIYGGDGLRKLVRHDWALLARRVRHPERFGVLVLRADGSLKKIVEKPRVPVSNLAWAGPAMLQPDVLEIDAPLSARGEYEFPDLVNELIRRGVRFSVETTELWLPANTPADVAFAEAFMRSRLRARRGRRSAR